MSNVDLESRIQQLEDIEAIRKLKHHYCALCDNDYEADALAALFTESAVWDGGSLGYASGREAIRKFFQTSPEVVKLAIHHVTNPIIEVKGDTATGKWYLWQPMVLNEGDTAMWLASRYSDEYVRIDGKWMFANVHLDNRLFSPYDEGYGKVPMTELPT